MTCTSFAFIDHQPNLSKVAQLSQVCYPENMGDHMDA